MEVSFLSVLLLGFLLGIKHSLEPDHIMAVSTIASQTKTLRRSSLAGVCWGIGHTATLFFIGLIFIVMKVEIVEVWAMSLEFLVGLMLIYLGITSVFAFRKAQFRQNRGVKAQRKPLIKSLLIGFVHGLAGSAAMILLTVSTVSSVLEGAVYILIFGLGTVIGMLFFTTIIGVPFVLSSNRISLNRLLTRLTGVASTVFGLYYIYNLGVTEGLFNLWIR